MQGVAANLAARMEQRYERSRFADVTDRADAPLPDALGLLVREKLTGQAPPGEGARRGQSLAPMDRGTRALGARPHAGHAVRSGSLRPADARPARRAEPRRPARPARGRELERGERERSKLGRGGRRERRRRSALRACGGRPRRSGDVERGDARRQRGRLERASRPRGRRIRSAAPLGALAAEPLGAR